MASCPKSYAFELYNNGQALELDHDEAIFRFSGSSADINKIHGGVSYLT